MHTHPLPPRHDAGDVVSRLRRLVEALRHLLAEVDQLTPSLSLAMPGGVRVTAQPLPPPTIPAAAKGGLGYEDIGRNPTASVRVLIGPWDGFEDGDTVYLVQGSTILHSERASAADKYGSVEMWVPNHKFALFPDGKYAFSARVENVLGAAVDSLPVDILIKISVPGGLDTDPSTPYVNEALALPVVVPTRVTPTTEEVRVTASAWANMFEGDRIVFRWGVTGNDIEHTVSADEAREKRDVTVVFDRTKIDRGGAGTGINVNYHITDIVGDWSLWSPSAKGVEVEDPNAPKAPWVKPTVGDEGDTIDLETLGTGDVIASISDLRKDDRVVVHLVGTMASGQAIPPWDSQPHSATADDQVLDVPIPNLQFKDLAQGRCTIWYTLTRAGVSQDSRWRSLAVNGKVALLSPPVVEEAIDDSIDPDTLGEAAHVLVAAHALIGFGAIVTMTMTGTTAGGTTVTHSESQDIGRNPVFPLRFTVPTSKLLQLKGRPATFSYVVDTFDTVNGHRVRRRLGTQALFPAPSRVYDIKGVSDDLPLPVVPQAQGDVIDPDRIDDMVLVRIDTSALTNGDIVILDWRGTGAAEPYTDELLVRGAQVEFRVPKAQLTPHIGANLLISYRVELRSGGTKYAGTLVLHVRKGIGALPKPGVDESGGVDTLLPRAITNGMTVRLPASLPLLPTDGIQVVVARPGFSHTTPAEDYRAGMTFRIAADVAGRFIGTQLTVKYQVLREGLLYDSETLALHVLPIDDEDATLFDAPYIEEAVGDRLNLGGAWANATVRVAPWPFMAVGQSYTIKVTSDAIDVATIQGVVSAADVTAGVRGALLRAELEKLDENARLMVSCEVDFRTGTPPIRFPARAYTLMHAKAGKPMPWYFENFDQLRLPERNNSGWPERVGNFTLSGENVVSADSGERPPLEGKYMSMAANGRVKFDHSAKTVRLVAYDKGGVELLNESGEVFHRGFAIDHWFTYLDSIEAIGGLGFDSKTLIDQIRWIPFEPDVPSTNSLDEDFNDVAIGAYGLQLTSKGWSFSQVRGQLAVVDLDGNGRKTLMATALDEMPNRYYVAVFTPRLMCRPRSIELDIWSDAPDGTTTVTAAYAGEDFLAPVRFVSQTITLSQEPQTIALPGGKEGEHLVSLQVSHDGRPNAIFFENILVIPEEAQWTTPIIKPSRNGKIVLPSFDGDLSVLIAPWPDIRVGQLYKLTVISGASKIVDVDSDVRSNEVVKGLSVTLPRDELEKLHDGAQLHVTFEVELLPGSGFVRFPAQTYTLVFFQSVRPMPGYIEDFDQLTATRNITPKLGHLTFSGEDGYCEVTSSNVSPWFRDKVISLDGNMPFEIKFDQLVKSIRMIVGSGFLSSYTPKITLLNDRREIVYSENVVASAGGSFSYIESEMPIRTMRIFNYSEKNYKYWMLMDNLVWVPFQPDVTSVTSLDESFEDMPAGSYGDSLRTEAWSISRGTGTLEVAVPQGQTHQALFIRETGLPAKAQYLDTFIPRLAVSPKSISVRLWSDTGGTTHMVAGYAKTVFSPVRYESTSVQRNSSSRLVSVGGARGGEYLVSLQLKHEGKPVTMYYDDIKVEV